MFEIFNDIYFVVYNLYYVGQNDDLEARAGPIHRDGGSMVSRKFKLKVGFHWMCSRNDLHSTL
jgi:hypothetical protein